MLHVNPDRFRVRFAEPENQIRQFPQFIFDRSRADAALEEL